MAAPRTQNALTLIGKFFIIVYQRKAQRGIDMRTVAFHTLGCKVNQYDSEAMLEQFLQNGWQQVAFTEKADVYVVNTCTVTGTGDKKSMQAVRRAQRLNPDAEIVIAGCLAQRDGEKLLETGARLVIGAGRRKDVFALLQEAVSENKQICAVEKDILRIPFERLDVSRFAEHTRAVMKIQEGCDRYCTYCIIPYVRGGIRSRPLEDIRAEAQRFAAAGYRELVLTGIHLTSYGRDLQGTDLGDAVEACRCEGIERIRLGSLEPVVVTEAFAKRMAAVPELCPQFHLALQSGSDSVLSRMRRRYTTEEFARSAALLRAYLPGCAITTDVIAGFPGETEQEHAQTLKFVREIGFSRMHVFPYSQRAGTAAAKMPNQVPRALREARARELIAVGYELAKAYHESMLSTEREMLVEEISDGCAGGYTREYVSCHVENAGALSVGSRVFVRVTGADADGVTGVMAD